jgi:hypothetical protein
VRLSGQFNHVPKPPRAQATGQQPLYEDSSANGLDSTYNSSNTQPNNRNYRKVFKPNLNNSVDNEVESNDRIE